MDLFKKEKRVAELAMKHIKKTGECLNTTAQALKNCAAGKVTDASAGVGSVNDLEGEADHLLREIREILYTGAYLPLHRGDVYRLMSAVDNVANKAEDAYDFCKLQKPKIGEEYQPHIVAIVDLTTGCYVELGKALDIFFMPKGDMDELRNHTRKVSELESLIDSNAEVLTAQIFESSAPMAEKLHLQMFISSILSISDVTEDAADELEWVSLKSII